MLLDIKKNNVIKSHIKIFKTFKELKKILPYGYIKTNLSKGQKFSFKNPTLLVGLEKEKNEKNYPTKITKNLLLKKIYIFFLMKIKISKKLYQN